MVAQTPFKDESRAKQGLPVGGGRSRARALFWDRPTPARAFRILRQQRRGFVPETTTAYPGQVYVASCDGLEAGVFKIGKSTDHFSKRSQALSQPTGVPGFYFPLYRLESHSFDELEKRALAELEAFRLHRRKEFVACPLERVIQTLRNIQRSLDPRAPFSEHYYVPIEEFESELKKLYEELLLDPSPKAWPRICLFLSLSLGLSPREVMLSLEAPAAPLPDSFPGRPLGSHLSWLLEYLRGLLHYGRLPYSGELAWAWTCCLCQAGDDEGQRLCAEVLFEDCERWEWYFRQWEDCLWEGVESLPLLGKIQSRLSLDSPSELCSLIHQKLRDYAAQPESELEAAKPSQSRLRDFHFI